MKIVRFEPQTNERGRLNALLVPMPSEKLADPLPARVTTVPFIDKERILFPPCSEKYHVPSEQTATPYGPFTVAFAAASKLEAVPFPAIVETKPGAVTKRIRLLLKSDTMKSPSAVTATPRGALNAAVVPFPSLKLIEPFPAKVRTNPFVRFTILKRWFPVPDFPSPTMRSPFGATAIELGQENRADEP
jgi:hypothetical protein